MKGGFVCAETRNPWFGRPHDCQLISDESATDFAYAMALFRRGATEDDVRSRLMEQRSDWKNHTGIKRKEAYLKKTIHRAKWLVEST